MADRACWRILDANFNRLREGLRVLEEIERLGRDNAALSGRLKRLRHEVSDCESLLPLKKRLEARDSRGDVGRPFHAGLEGGRKGLAGLAAANFKRCQEAARVLEEFIKLFSPAAAGRMKKIRFKLYDFEKDYSFHQGY